MTLSGALSNDLFSLLLCVILLVVYHIQLRRKEKKNPAYTVRAVNIIARTAWVESIMKGEGKEVLAVQTLRNSTMAATFLASTAVLLIIGVLTLSGEGDKLESSWHVLNIFGAKHPELWIVKLILLLLDLFVAISVFNHVGYMINVPLGMNHHALSPKHVSIHLNRAGKFYNIGMRAYYFTVPLVFWLFGPHFMLLATIALIVVLYYLDHAPKVLAADNSVVETLK
jgi:uncharacterized membrane protein